MSSIGIVPKRSLKLIPQERDVAQVTRELFARPPFWQRDSLPMKRAPPEPVKTIQPISGFCPRCDYAWPGCICGANPAAKQAKGR